jgi:hypothetical protein
MGPRGHPPEKRGFILRLFFAVEGEGFDFVCEENCALRSYPAFETHEANKGVMLG